MKKSDSVADDASTDNGLGLGTMPLPTMPSEVGPRERRENRGGPEGWYEKLYKMLLGSIPFSLILIDRALRVVSANRNFIEKAQRTERNTIGAPIREVFPSAILEYTRLEIKIRGVFDTGLPLRGAQMTYRAPGIS